MTRLVVERLNAGDAAGVAALYEPQAVLAYPADRPTTGRGAIQAVYQQMVDAGLRFGVETPLPTVRFEDLALTSTRSADNTGVRVQVLRRQPSFRSQPPGLKVNRNFSRERSTSKSSRSLRKSWTASIGPGPKAS